MSQRSQTNDRYRKEADIGSTRKSAARAKPVRRLGTIEGSSASSAKDSGKAKKKPVRQPLPTSPEIKRWRMIWWGLFALAFVCILVNWLLPAARDNQTITMALTVTVFVLCAVAVYIDAVKIRKLRAQLIKEQGKKSKNKTQTAASGK